MACFKDLAKGEIMFRETAIMKETGYASAYTCIPCLDKWIDSIK